MNRVNAFAELLEKIPAQDWYRNWPADRTIMLSMTSKKIRDIINNMNIPAIVQLNWKFFNDSNNGIDSKEVKLDFIMIQLQRNLYLYLYKITTLVLKRCDIQINIEELVKVLEQCPMLQKLNLKGNNITPEGVGKITQAIEQYNNQELNYLDLSINKIGDIGAIKVAELLCNNKCSKLLYVNLSLNKIGDVGTEKLALALGKYPNLMLIELDLSHNLIRADGVDSLISKCSTIKRLDLSWNYIGLVEAASLAKRHNIDLSTLFQMRTVSFP
jgi:Ran GTPase-activating protein (RanGAP) involved in mRNA processing and transport